MSEMLNIRIDGKECACQKGEYLYDVARRNGIAIPVLCRSDAFANHRACCRICIVEVEIRGRRKVVTSCVYPVEQECDVFTKSEKWVTFPRFHPPKKDVEIGGKLFIFFIFPLFISVFERWKTF